MISSRSDLERVYNQEWRKVFGTSVGNGFDRMTFLRRKARELSELFDVQGWPASDDEILPYVQRTLERYG